MVPAGAPIYSLPQCVFSMGAPARALSGADFDPPPSAFKARLGKIAAESRPQNGPSERRPGPRNSAEPEVAWADHPGDWFGRVGLGLGRARLRKDAQRENGGRERWCGFYHPDTLLDRGAASCGAPPRPYPITRATGGRKEFNRTRPAGPARLSG